MVKELLLCAAMLGSFALISCSSEKGGGGETGSSALPARNADNADIMRELIRKSDDGSRIEGASGFRTRGYDQFLDRLESGQIAIGDETYLVPTTPYFTVAYADMYSSNGLYKCTIHVGPAGVITAYGYEGKYFAVSRVSGYTNMPVWYFCDEERMRKFVALSLEFGVRNQ